MSFAGAGRGKGITEVPITKGYFSGDHGVRKEENIPPGKPGFEEGIDASRLSIVIIVVRAVYAASTASPGFLGIEFA